MPFRLWYVDLVDALKYGSVMPLRWMLAIASLVYAGLTAMAPDLPFLPHRMDAGAAVLTSGWRWQWALLFVLHSSILWWRIFDQKPRGFLGALVNIITLALWAGVLVASIVTSDNVSPDLTGYVIFVLVAAHVLWRTDFTIQDRSTA